MQARDDDLNNPQLFSESARSGLNSASRNRAGRTGSTFRLPELRRLPVSTRSHFLITIALLVLPLAAFPAMAASRLVGDLPRVDNQPLETLPGIDTEFGELRMADGARLRTIVTKPEGTRGRLPAVLFVQWLSCDSIELKPEARDGWSVMLRRLMTESGMLWQRTDKAGVGDSVGIPCAELDYETELAHHRAALAALRARPDVDPQRIVIYGASMGSNYAPLIAAGQDVAGVMVWGGGAHTWFERMLRFERNALELRDADPQTLAAEVNARAAFFSHYLLNGETPAQIAQSNAELGKVWERIVGTDGDTHYGRPLAFHQQAQQQNWAGAWARVNSPVLVLYGDYDWFETRDSAALITDLVNRQRPGTATLHVEHGLDHHFTRFATARDAFTDTGGTEHAAPIVEVVLDWLEEIGARPRPD
jgi:dienelactone hydrolase